MKVLGNGKRRFDREDKERLIDACLAPGVSLAKLALDHGVNANQLRNWVTARRRKEEKANGLIEASAFVPVVEEAPAIMALPAGDGDRALEVVRGSGRPGAVRPRSSRMRVKVALANGVRLELEGADSQVLSAMIEALGRCDVPAGR